MPDTKCISDLEDCKRALEEARAGKAVLLNKGAVGRFALMTYQEYDKVLETLKEVSGSSRNRDSAENAWLSAVEVQDEARDKTHRTSSMQTASKRS